MERTGTGSGFWEAALLALASICAATVICMAMDAGKPVYAAIVAIIPAAILTVMMGFEYKHVAYWLLFSVNYFIPLVGRYWLDAPIGIIMDVMIAFNLLVILCHMMSHDVSFSRITWDALAVTSVWLVYCILECFNPRMLSIHVWFTHIRNMGLYFFIIILITQISIESFDSARKLIAIWSVLTLIAVGKALIQKYVGFDAAEKYFLYVMDGQRTHLLHTGTRYFSIFTDASNFGAQMGVASVVFACMGINSKGALRWYYWIVAAIAIYGLLISGTRSALAVPFLGFAAYIVLCGNIRQALPVAALLGAVFIFLAYTDIGQGNAVIRRARSAFDHSDESYQVRLENREKLKPLMAKLPFGNSLGMSAGRGKKYGDTSEIAEIPTDSWFVQLWVETGIVGLALYLAMMAYLLCRGGWLVMFRVHDKEIKGICAGLLAGVAGLFAMSTNNEVFSQYPNSIIAYTSVAIVFMGPYFSNQKAKDND